MVYRWILLLLVQVKHKGEFSQVFIIKNRVFRRGNKDKEFQQDNKYAKYIPPPPKKKYCLLLRKCRGLLGVYNNYSGNLHLLTDLFTKIPALHSGPSMIQYQYPVKSYQNTALNLKYLKSTALILLP